MAITLDMIRAPDGVPLEMRRIEGGELSIGRGAEANWVLQDPDRTISKLHCVIKWRADGWWVEDWSANGTFLRRNPDRIGRGQAAPLRDLDRLSLAGCYEFEIRVEAEQPMAPSWPQGRPAAPSWPDSPPPPYGRDAGQPVPRHPPVNLFDDPPAPPPAEPRIDWGSPPPPPPPPPVADRMAPPTQPPPPQGVDARAALAAFLQGMGMAPQAAVQFAAQHANPAGALRAFGAAFAAATLGARRMLAARTSVKHEFRIDQTQMRPSGNNPLKFAADDQAALAAMVTAPAEGAEAIAQAFRDLEDHQVATLVATQAAARALLDGLSPATVEAQVPAGGLLAGQRKPRLWDAYVALHDAMAQRFDDNFDSVFGRAFAEAYEKASRGRG